MLGRVKIGDKVLVQVRGSQAYFPDSDVGGEVTWSDPDTVAGTQVYTVRVQPERDDSTVPAQRWPTRDIDLRVPETHLVPVLGEVIAVRMVRRG